MIIIHQTLTQKTGGDNRPIPTAPYTGTDTLTGIGNGKDNGTVTGTPSAIGLVTELLLVLILVEQHLISWLVHFLDLCTLSYNQPFGGCQKWQPFYL